MKQRKMPVARREESSTEDDSSSFSSSSEYESSSSRSSEGETEEEVVKGGKSEKNSTKNSGNNKNEKKEEEDDDDDDNDNTERSFAEDNDDDDDSKSDSDEDLVQFARRHRKRLLRRQRLLEQQEKEREGEDKKSRAVQKGKANAFKAASLKTKPSDKKKGDRKRKRESSSSEESDETSEDSSDDGDSDSDSSEADDSGGSSDGSQESENEDDDEETETEEEDAKPESGKKSRCGHHRKGRMTEDGVGMVPLQKPRLDSKGLYCRPKGRQPVNMDWDSRSGIWVNRSEGQARGALDDPDEGNKDDYDIDEHTAKGSKKTPKRRNRGGTSGVVDYWISEKPSASAGRSAKRKSAPPPRSDQEVDDEILPDNDSNSNNNNNRGKRKDVNVVKELKYHASSKWQEPPRDGDLTLYEMHRQPRPVVSGELERPLRLLSQEFKCVICLGYIRRTRIVMECLHRFCEECIERSLRMGRNECPICRVFVPSRRSLAPDPNFDRLMKCIIGQSVLDEDYEDDEGGAALIAQANLQQQIHQKKILLMQEQRRERERKQKEQESADVDDDEEENDGAEDAGEEVEDEDGDDEDGSQQDKDEQGRGIEEDRLSLGVSLNLAPTELPPLIEINLIRHPAEKHLEELERPFLRISGTATVKVLKKFLSHKFSAYLAHINEERREENRDDNIGMQITSTLNGKPVMLGDWVNVEVIAKRLHDKPTDNRNYLTLYYRLTGY